MSLLISLLLFLFLLTLVLCYNDTVVCAPGEENDCSKCYAVLVQSVIQNDKNLFAIQNVFFPPQTSSPVFVSVSYEYKDPDNGSVETEVWFWSASAFYLLQPLHVFQFTSLFFSDTQLQTSQVHLTLPLNCFSASEPHKKLLTQRLKLYATRSPVTTPVDDAYDAKAETVASLKEWHIKWPHYSRYVIADFIFFPVFSWVFLGIIVWYMNDYGPEPRMKAFQTIFKMKNDEKLWALKLRLQDDFTLSLFCVVYSFLLSIAAVVQAELSEKTLGKEIPKYYSSHNVINQFELMHNIVYVPLVYNIVAFIFFPLVFIFCIYKWKKNDDIPLWWRFCAYSMYPPLCCLVNHLNYIIIAFIHDLYHATSVAIVYGVVIIFLYVMLNRIPYVVYGSSGIVAEKDEEQVGEQDEEQVEEQVEEQDEEQEGEQDEEQVAKPDEEQTEVWCVRIKRVCNNRIVRLQVIKFVTVILLLVYVAMDIALLYILPIEDAFEDAANHFISVYHTTILFFTALVVYFIIRQPSRSQIRIFTRAINRIFDENGGDNSGLLDINKDDWEKLNGDQKDVEIAKRLLKKLQ